MMAALYPQIGSKRKPPQYGSWLAHRVRAEVALGHPLPPGAVVHHVDGTRAITSPLVICPDQGYHTALHARMRVRAAGGNPWTDKLCNHCHRPKPVEAFGPNPRGPLGRAAYCRVCAAVRMRAYTARKRQLAAAVA